MNRMTNRSITLASGVKGTDNETYGYDPIGRLTNTMGSEGNWLTGTGRQTSNTIFTYD